MSKAARKLPTLVFVPGSWHRPSCYSKIITLLHDQHSIRCVPVTLPSTRGNPDATYKEDIDTTRHAIATETGQGRDVVVLAHSYGGMVGNSAIKGFARPRSSQGTSPPSSSILSAETLVENDQGHVVGLILIASGFTLSGLSFMDPFFGHPPPSWKVNKETGFAEIIVPPGDLFYHDLPKDEKDYWVSQLTPQSLKSLFEGGEHSYSGWQDVPTWYIGTVEDKGLPVVVQRMLVGMARGLGAVVEHRELKTSHSPFLSQPQHVVDIIREALDVFDPPLELALHHPKKLDPRTKGAMVPSVKLVRPLTWLNIGVPSAFGRSLGWCIAFWGWSRRIVQVPRRSRS